MPMYLQLFSTAHIVILALIPLGAWLLAVWVKQNAQTYRRIRFALGFVIGVNELVWYGYVIYRGWVAFPYGLPLDLCDIVLWLTVFTLFTLKPWSFNLIYYWGLVGTGMAVLTPDIGATFPSYIAIKFLFAHGSIVMAILFLVWSKYLRPQIGSWWKAFLWINVYTVAVGAYNLIFSTNYFFLCQKPASSTLLDYFGPWPWYLLAGEGVAVILFFMLGLPFRRNKL